MVNAGYIFDQVRAMLDDQEQGFATDDYLRTFLQIAQDDLVTECLNDPNIGQIKAAVVLPTLAIGTTSLAQEFLPGGRLELLTDIVELREKRAGDQDTSYQMLTPRYVPSNQPAQSSFNRVYTYTGSDILLPGANQTIDLWVWGSFAPARITSPETPIVQGIESILKYGCAKGAAGSRGNAATKKECRLDQAIQQSAWMRQIYKIQQSIRVTNRPWRAQNAQSYIPASE